MIVVNILLLTVCIAGIGTLVWYVVNHHSETFEKVKLEGNSDILSTKPVDND